MTLPATITTAALFPDFRNAPIGPYESGGNLYVVLVDKTNNRLRVYKSADGGQTWTEQDSSTTVTIGASGANKSCWTQAIGSLLYVWYFRSGSLTVGHRAFDMSTDTWGAELWSLTLATSPVAGGHASAAFPVFAARRSDGSSIIVVQGATETVMGSSYRRAKLYTVTSGGTATGPFDVAGSANTPLADTLPGTQSNQDIRAVLLGTSDRVHIFYTDGSTTPTTLKTRVLSSANAFTAAAVTITSAVSAGSYCVGLPCLHTAAGGVVTITVPFAFSTGPWLYTAQAAASAADVAANWTTAQVSSVNAMNMAGTNALAISDGGTKRWAWWEGSSAQNIYDAHDAGAGVWGAETLWKNVTGTVIQGISAQLITGAIGIVYSDATGTPTTPKYDRLVIFLAKASQSVGSTITERDLGSSPPTELLVELDADDDGSGALAGDVTMQVESRADPADAWTDRGTVVCTSGAGGTGAVNVLSAGDRYVRTTVTVSGSASAAGASGV